MLGAYSRLLRMHAVTLPLAAAFVGALPIGMLTLALLLLGRDAFRIARRRRPRAGALAAGNASAWRRRAA